MKTTISWLLRHWKKNIRIDTLRLRPRLHRAGAREWRVKRHSEEGAMKFLNRVETSELAADQYATAEEFHCVFTQEMDGLYQLSFLLTGDHAKAERCFVAGLDDCAKENHVFRDWARSWAKRTIIQNAIRELHPHPCAAESFSDATIPNTHHLRSDPIRHFEDNAVLALADFERFVFVISVLERYSVHDCALFLQCSQRQVLEARSRALMRLAGLSPVGFSCESSSEDLQEASR